MNKYLLESGKSIAGSSRLRLRLASLTTLFDRLPALVLGLGSFALYLATLAPTVLFADGGEFQFVPYILGIAHPTGYPLYLLLGWAWSHALPLADVAYRMNLFSALWAALSVSLTYLVALRFVRRAVPSVRPRAARLASAAAAATFAVGQTFWSQAIIAEVYSFNAFFLALVLLLLFWTDEALQRAGANRATANRAGTSGAPTAAAPTLRISPIAVRSLTLAAVFGLSLTHHHTMLLLLPGLLAFLWLRRRSQQVSPWGSSQTQSVLERRAAPRTRPLSLLAPSSALRKTGFALALLIAVAAPWLLYLYLPLRAPHTPYALLPLSETQTLTLYDNTWQGFLDHVRASAFVGNLALSSPSADPLGLPRPQGSWWVERLAMAWHLLRGEIGLVGIGLALIGLARLVITDRLQGSLLLALTGLGYLANFAFTLVYLIGDVQVLFIPSYLFVSLWLALGVVTLGHAVAAAVLRWKASPVAYADFGHQGYRRLTERIYHLVMQVVAVLGLALPIALLVAHLPVVDQSKNTQAADMWQAILEQPIPEGTLLLSNDRNEIMPLWYYQYVAGRRPDLLGLFPRIVDEPGYATLGGLIDQALLSQRPVYLIKPMPGLEVKAQLDPADDLAPLVRVIGPSMERPPLHPRQVALAGVMRLVGYDQSPSSARPGEKLTVTLYWQPQSEIAFDYTSYVHLVDESGRGITQSDHRPGGDYYPSSLWRPGEVLRDDHVLTLPQDAAPGVYRLVVGMYRQPSLEPLGGMADVGLLAVKDPASVQMTFPGEAQSRSESLRTTEVQFGESITLLGYDPQLPRLSQGGQVDRLQLTLYWQTERPLDESWTVFVHVLNSAGSIIAQRDNQPRDGRYPTLVWDQGEVVDDSHAIRLPAGLPEGNYQVAVGLYSLESGERLPVFDSQGNPVGDSISLLSLTLSEGEWRIN